MINVDYNEKKINNNRIYNHDKNINNSDMRIS